MRVLLVPQKSNYPDPGPCLDIIGQGIPYLAAALQANGHEVFGLNLNYRWCHDAANDLQQALRESGREQVVDIKNAQDESIEVAIGDQRRIHQEALAALDQINNRSHCDGAALEGCFQDAFSGCVQSQV